MYRITITTTVEFEDKDGKYFSEARSSRMEIDSLRPDPAVFPDQTWASVVAELRLLCENTIIQQMEISNEHDQNSPSV